MTQTHYNPDDLLRGYDVEDFPGRHVYPLEASPEILDLDAGRRWPTFRDARQGQMRLEALWQPLYDLKGTGQGSFFAHAKGARAEVTNVPWQNQLPWPKRYHVWEIALEFPADLDVRELVLRMIVGEKIYVTLPVTQMLIRTAPPGRARRFLPLCAPIYIPSVQYFTVALENYPPEPADIGCVLGGYMYREIC